MHCVSTPGFPAKRLTASSEAANAPTPPARSNFHTYTLEVDRTAELEAVRWFVDAFYSGKSLRPICPQTFGPRRSTRLTSFC
ncbi:hypothetical protein BDP55DRAFT_245010 [Colletotrichum godetiae]|uniref:Uncharacterized protein n=1 Tax=Colletotrichum godetiae TaxID=1209918 RepID=A0AAJ0AI35_9PEZI|nr:uncharacterized protein BDP55DRAFT_245010 [Colletotrichum godetiae]KAK1672767.1 hypothetical protein BDP55DRAFT_245010 [Colletotrichum godetiae]